MRTTRVLITPFALGACSITWEGIKQDTSELGKIAGETVEKTGEAIRGVSE